MPISGPDKRANGSVARRREAGAGGYERIPDGWNRKGRLVCAFSVLDILGH